MLKTVCLGGDSTFRAIGRGHGPTTPTSGSAYALGAKKVILQPGPVQRLPTSLETHPGIKISLALPSTNMHLDTVFTVHYQSDCRLIRGRCTREGVGEGVVPCHCQADRPRAVWHESQITPAPYAATSRCSTNVKERRTDLCNRHNIFHYSETTK